jgi:hypothetical protein
MGQVASRHPEAVLARMAAHVAYELQMVGALMDDATEAPAGSLGLAVQESYLLHIRTLSAFLGTTSERAWPDDVVADDYFRGPHEPFTPLVPDDRRDIDQRLSHLSTDRLRGPVPGAAGSTWRAEQDRSYWGRRVLREFSRFVEALHAESPSRAAWFEDALTAAKRSAHP